MVYPTASTQGFEPPSKKFSQYLITGNQQSMKLTHLFAMLPFDPPENISSNVYRGIKREHWEEMG